MGDSAYTHLTLAQLRDKAKLSANANEYSSRSWLQNAARTAEQAKQDDAQGRTEQAFVGYLKACQFFQAFLDHRDYQSIKKEGERNVAWFPYVEFSQRRAEYLQRARVLADVLKQRPVEAQAEAETSTPISEPATPTTKPADEPDTTSGGSIAARLAALKGAGMQVAVSKRTSRDLGSQPTTPATPSQYVTANSQTLPVSAGQTLPVSAGWSNGADRRSSTSTSRRGSLASQTGAQGVISEPMGSNPTQTPRVDYSTLDTNKTGSSLNSIRSFERYQQPTASPRVTTTPLTPGPTNGHAPAAAATASRPQVIQEDEEIAYFASAFPSLDEFEGKPEFVEPTGGDQAKGIAPPLAPSIDRQGPSPADAFAASMGNLIVPDPVQRPSSLPMPETGQSAATEKLHVSTLTASEMNGAISTSPPPRNKPPLPPIPNAKPKALASTSGAAKPALPFTNSVLPDVLYGYIQDPSLRLLVVDTRTGEERKEGWIGQDVDGGRVKEVWVDPTILARPGLDSIKLENALSLLPTAEHQAFLNRQQNDLVVLYDASSTSFPKPGSQPSAPGTLFSIIFENEFRKSLPRSPVLLVGGYRAWKEEVGRRRAKGERKRNGNGNADSSGYVAVAKGPPPVISTKKPSLPLPPGPDSADSRALRRDTGVYRSSAYSRNITDNFNSPYPQSMVGLNHQAYNGQPMIPHSTVPTNSRSGQPSAYTSSPYTSAAPTPPPLASTSPGPLSRKRSDYVDQHNKPYSGYQGHASRPSMDYPQINHPSIPQPPPAAATSSSERQESRPRADRSASIISFDGLSRLPESDDMMYWNDVALGISGLKNLGNTCYMNSTLQCLSATYPLARFFRDGSFKRAINTVNPMGTKGDLAKAFATLISVLWNEQYTFLSPVTFRKSISTYAPSFAGTDQHDSQEFLSFLLDGLHEDLNRIRTKPPPVEMTPEREAALETLPPSVAAEKEWQIYKQRNDSLIVDLFQGQYRNRMECLTCHKTSTTYDAFMYLSLPVPQGKQKVVLYELIDNFVQTEVMEKDDAWNCPRCKVPRKATKSLSIARLPPVLLIHLKRFTTTNGVFWDKSETPVIFPVKHLDLTRYIPPSPAQIEGKNPSGPASPTSTTGPFLYDLFAISNHMGNLSNGHYTAFVNSSKGWKYCDDSKVTHASERDVISKPAHAYILWYKRTLPPRTSPATAA